MPTTRKRHTITETDEVERALRPFRERGIAVSLSELVIKGAEAGLAEIQAGIQEGERRSALRERFLERVDSGQGIDIDAALDVRGTGWSHVPPGTDV